MKSLLRSIFRSILNVLMSNKSTIPLANYIYEIGSFKLKDFFILNVSQPEFDFHWNFNLLNGKKVRCNVINGKQNTWHFATSYKWHDLGLSIIEQHLNEFYDSNLTYMDIGSNVGLRSVYSLSTSRNTILIDPNPEVNKITKSMIELNGFKNYSVEQIGLSDSEIGGELKFYISSSAYMSSFNKEHAAQDKIVGEIIIPVTSIDKYIASKPEVKPGILKIDVEGFEMNVLKGAKNTLEKYKPAIVIEILDMGENRNAIVDYLAQFSYKPYFLFNKDEKMLKPLIKGEQITNHNYLFVANSNLESYLREKNCVE
jgi:FkbM family methyltransferase